MTVEEKLAQAFEETARERSERLMKVEKKHRFSLAYKLWERKTLHDLRCGKQGERWTLKKARYAVAAMAAAFTLLIGGTAYATVIMIGRYGFEDKVDYSKMLIKNRPSDKTTFEEYYGLPEEDGWEIVDCSIFQTYISLTYNREEQKVVFHQYIIDDVNMGSINTEKADIEMLSLYTENDGFIMDFGEDGCLLHWVYDGYLFSISSNFNKDDTVNLAHSTKIVVF